MLPNNVIAAAKVLARNQAAITDNITISNSTTETTLLEGPVVALTDRENEGLHLKFEFSGTLTSQGELSGNDLTFALMYGSTDLFEIAASDIQVNASETPWQLHGSIRIHTSGASGAIAGMGRLDLLRSTPLIFSARTDKTGVAVNLAKAEPFKLTARWGTASSNNALYVNTGYFLPVKGA